MTNKKFKIAAMSVALTACVAAQPLIANAADEVESTPDLPGDDSTQNTDSTSAQSSSSSMETNINQEEKDSKEAFGDNVDVKYDPTTEVKDPATGSSTIDGTIEKTDPDSKDETGDGEKADGKEESEEKEETGDGEKSEDKGETGDGEKSEEKEETPDGEKTVEDEKTEEKEEIPDGEKTVEDEKTEEKEETSEGEKTEGKDESFEGSATKTETPESTKTDPPVPNPGAEPQPDPSRESTTEEKPDGTTTVTNPTVTEGTQTTTTTGSGTASGTTTDTKKETFDKGEFDLEKELGGKPDIDWDKVTENPGDYSDVGNGYKVSDVQTEDDRQTLTLTKTETSEGTMTSDDIAKLVDAEKTDLGDGSYVLKRTEEVKDESGKVVSTRTTYITVKEGDSHVSISTTTTLTVTREREQHSGTETVSNDFKVPEIMVTDKESPDSKKTISSEKLNDLIQNHPGETTPDGKTIYNVIEEDDNGVKREYTITVDSTASKLSAAEIAEKLGDGFMAEGNDVYYIDTNGNRSKLSVEQTDKIRETLSYTVSMTETKKAENATIEGKAEAEAKAKDEAVRNALKASVDKMLADGSISEAEADSLKDAIASAAIDAEKSDTFKYTVGSRTFTLDYKAGTITGSTSADLPDTDTTVDNKNTTVTGTSYVTTGKVEWTESGSESGSYSKSFGDKWEAPEGAEVSKDGDKTIYKVVNGNVTTIYEVTEETLDFADLSKEEQEAIAWEQLAEKVGKKGATADELKKAGYSISDLTFTGSVKKVSWTAKQTTTTTKETEDSDSYREISLNDTIQKTADGKYTIKVDGKPQTGFESSDGRTFTKKDGDKTITVTVTDGNALDAGQIRDLIAEKYNLDSSITLDVDTTTNTASYTDSSTGKKYTFYYSNAISQSISVKEETHASVNKTTEDDLISAVKEKLGELNSGDQLQMSGKETYTITKKADGTYTISGGDLNEKILSSADVEKTVTEIVKKIASNHINYGDLTAKDIWELLDLQQVYADGKDNEYIASDKACTDSYWPEDGFQNINYKDESGTSYGEVPSQDATHFDHLSLDAEVSIKDDETGKTYDGVLLSKDLTFTYGHKEEVAGYVDMSKYPDKNYWGSSTYDKNKLHTTNTGKTASLSDTITTTDGKVWNGTSYENVNNKLTYSYTATDSNDFSGKRFYNISGQVAYDKRGTNLTEKAATDLLADLQKSGNKNATIVPIQTKNGIVYNVYANVTNLNAIGYMTASANTSSNQNYDGGYWEYTGQGPDGWSYVHSTWNPGCGKAYYGNVNAGDYDLRIQGLKLVNGKVQGNYGVKYNLGLTTIRNTGASSDNALTMNKTTTTITNENTTPLDGGHGGTKSGTFGYSYNHALEDNFKWTEDETRGEGQGTYKSFLELIRNTFTGRAENVQKDDGSFSYSYTTETDLNAEAKETVTVKNADVKYTYTTIETSDVLIPGEEIVEITPERPDDPSDDENTPDTPDTPDSPVLPTNPELPPVQDARPDEITETAVLPTNPVLPPVQDARMDAALPQTGVNWLTAIGLALSGVTLMAAGAFTTLTGKGKKEQH